MIEHTHSGAEVLHSGKCIIRFLRRKRHQARLGVCQMWLLSAVIL